MSSYYVKRLYIARTNSWDFVQSLRSIRVHGFELEMFFVEERLHGDLPSLARSKRYLRILGQVDRTNG